MRVGPATPACWSDVIACWTVEEAISGDIPPRTSAFVSIVETASQVRL
jgi:hypothetical protein